MKKWIVNKSIHLGSIKVSVGVGTIIEHDEANNKLIIDGNAYSPTKDLDILRKHGWVDEFNTETKKKADKEVEKEKAKQEKEKVIIEQKKKTKVMPVVNSDADEHVTIDITHTRKAKPIMKEINSDMEVIKAEETLQERVERKASTIPKMPIVPDDSQTSIGIPLNTDKAVKKSKEEYEKIKQENMKKAKETELKLKQEWEKKQQLLPSEVDGNLNPLNPLKEGIDKAFSQEEPIVAKVKKARKSKVVNQE